MNTFEIPFALLYRDDDEPELVVALVPYDVHDFETAKPLLENIARAGNVHAIFKYANTLEKLGLDDDAEHFWRIAIDGGHTAACNNLANRLKVIGRRDEAFDLYMRAAEAGEVDAMFNLGLFLEEIDPEKSDEWLIKAVDGRHPKACANMALRQFKRENVELAFEYAQRGIERNDGFSALSIAIHYQNVAEWQKVLEYARLALGLDDPLREGWVRNAYAIIALALVFLERFDEAETALLDCEANDVDANTVADTREFLNSMKFVTIGSSKCSRCDALIDITQSFCTNCGQATALASVD